MKKLILLTAVVFIGCKNFHKWNDPEDQFTLTHEQIMNVYKNGWVHGVGAYMRNGSSYKLQYPIDSMEISNIILDDK